jgi:plasmid replication initiation protein
MGITKAVAKVAKTVPDAGEPGSKWVSMSNALTRSSQGLTLAEKRLMMCAVSKLDSRAPVPGQCPVVKISAMEYADTFNLDPATAYEQLQTGAKNLYTRSINFFEPSHKRGGKPIVVTKTMRWVGEVHYQKKEGWLELHFWHAVVPHLMGLRKQFTSYQLEQASALRSMYSWRLLELLMRFKATGRAEYTIEDFCKSMDATEKQRANFAKIRTKIIEPAVKELNEKDGWLIQWEAIKTGRRVTGVRFNFMKNPQQQLEL